MQALAAIATRADRTRGRAAPEPESQSRSAFQRDRDRIVHAAAFRKLQYKTQVFVYHEGDYFRTRLTHSLEVAQIARSIARTLALDEDLAEALALAHDLGHPPFAHAGETALERAMADYGGFDHNAQTLRVLTKLEQRYAAFDGLNLTWEALEGIAKHNGPVTGPLPWALAEVAEEIDLELDTYAGPEAQVAALSDDIAYDNHDIEDGVRAGLLPIEEVREVPLIGPLIREVEVLYPGLSRHRLVHEAKRRMTSRMIEDLVVETRRRLAADKPQSAADVRALGRPLVAFSAQLETDQKALKAFLMQRLYRHYKVNRMTSKVRRVVADLFAMLIDEPECLPDDWRRSAGAPRSQATARTVCDYLAGMTDRFAFAEHARLFDLESKA